jgi:hypothetical protein
MVGEAPANAEVDSLMTVAGKAFRAFAAAVVREYTSFDRTGVGCQGWLSAGNPQAQSHAALISAAIYLGIGQPWFDDLPTEERPGGGIAWVPGDHPAAGYCRAADAVGEDGSRCS